MAGDKDHKDAGDSLPTIADDLVVTKYKMAAEIVNSKSGFTDRVVLAIHCSLQQRTHTEQKAIYIMHYDRVFGGGLSFMNRQVSLGDTRWFWVKTVTSFDVHECPPFPPCL